MANKMTAQMWGPVNPRDFAVDVAASVTDETPVKTAIRTFVAADIADEASAIRTALDANVGGSGTVQFTAFIPAQAENTNEAYVIGRFPVSGTVTAGYLMPSGNITGVTATAWRLDLQRHPSTGGGYTTVADVDFITGTDAEDGVEVPLVLADSASRSVTEGEYAYVWNRVGANSVGTLACLVVLIIEPS